MLDLEFRMKLLKEYHKDVVYTDAEHVVVLFDNDYGVSLVNKVGLTKGNEINL